MGIWPTVPLALMVMDDFRVCSPGCCAVGLTALLPLTMVGPPSKGTAGGIALFSAAETDSDRACVDAARPVFDPGFRAVLAKPRPAEACGDEVPLPAEGAEAGATDGSALLEFCEGMPGEWDTLVINSVVDSIDKQPARPVSEKLSERRHRMSNPVSEMSEHEQSPRRGY